MAQSKNTKRSGTRRSTAARGGRRAGNSRTSRRAQRRAERAHLLTSLALLGAGLLILALVLVRGQEESGWRVLRSWLFGACGIITYLVGPLLLYLAYLVASGYLVGKFTAKVGLLATLCASIPVVFSGLSFQGLTFLQAVSLLFTTGQTQYWSGGVLGGVLGGPLVAFCGRPGANIIMVLVLLLGLMVFFAVTPVDIVQFVVYYWQRAQAALAERAAAAPAPDPEQEPLEAPAEPRPQFQPELAAGRHMFAANPYLDPIPAPAAREPAPPEPAAPPAPYAPPAAQQPARADFDVDLGPDIEQKALQNAVEHDPLEPVIIGPGGTFGLDPLKNLGNGHKAAAPVPETAATEFDQHLDGNGTEEAEAAEADDIGELIRKAMADASQGQGAHAATDTLPAEEEFDTLLEPVPEADTGILPAEAFGTAPAAPMQDGGVGITPAPAFGVPTLDGSYDPVRDAWESGVPLAEALHGAPAAEPAADPYSFAEDTAALPPEAPATAAATRYRARISRAAPAAAEGPTAVPPPSEEKALPPETLPQPRPYAYPSLDLFNATRPEDEAGAEREMRHNADVLVNTLDSFGVKTRILDICRGPSVTRYELQPQAGIKVSRITSLADDIALNLATAGVRIEAPIPGKPAVGIEVPNKIRSTVNIRTVFESQNYINMRSPLTMALGKDIAGVAQVADLCRMPHLLIAGSTGSGKSVCVNSIIISFLFRSSPEDVKLLLIDPKVVELAEYNGIPHLLMPVVTEPRKAAGALGASVAEMERRYQLFAEHNVREIKAFNKLAQSDPSLEHLPYIAIVIDELADLMMVAGKEVEDYICRIAQKARAAGIHLIVATQRPSVDVITGLIKANIPSRIAFAVSSQVDSRTILDSAGAEKLLGNGDMLFLPVGAAKPVRVQGTFVTDEEIGAVLSFIKSTSDAQYDEEMIANVERLAIEEKGSKKGADSEDAGGALDPMFEQAVECVIEAGQASTSLLQRRCKLGYARAARIMDQMEQEKVIGPYEGAKPRSVLITLAQWQERKLSAHGN